MFETGLELRPHHRWFFYVFAGRS